MVVLSPQVAPDTGTSGSAAKAPFPAGSLHAPLTPSQRGTIYKYLKSARGYTPQNIHEYIRNVLGTWLDTPGAKSDKVLIDIYNTVVNGGGISINGPSQTNNTYHVPGVSSVVDFLQSAWGTITNPGLWLRIGEGVLGLILIGIGFSKLTGIEPPVIKALT